MIYTVKSIETSPLKRAKIDLDVFSEDPVKELVTIQDPATLIEDPEEKLEPIQIEESYVDYEIFTKNEATEQIIPLPDQVSISVQTETVDQIDREIQTDKIDDPVKEVPSTDSKDDKLITLLYPEYIGKNKIELIKMIIERNQKVKSLEEEKQLLEDAMRKLL
jgi:hypothetical protein